MNIQKHLAYFFYSLLLFIFGMVMLPDSGLAQQNSLIELSSDVDSEVVSRFTETTSIRIITSRDKSVNLVVAASGIAIQFTDDFLNDLEREIRKEKREEDNSTLANLITAMIGSGVRTLLDHTIMIPYYEISGVSLVNGKIVITGYDGDELFEELEINDKKVMGDFSRRDARQFIADAEKQLI